MFRRRSSQSTGIAQFQLRFFWGSWTGSTPSAPTKQKSPSIFAQMNTSTNTSARSSSPKSVSLADAISPAKVSAAIQASSGTAPDAHQQRLIDAGLTLLENAKNIDKYSANQLQALDAVAVLVFSDTLSATMPVYEQFQVISDALFMFGDSKEDAPLYSALLDILDAFMPPEVFAIFNDSNLPAVLATEEDRLAFVGCVKLSLGDNYDNVSNAFDGAVRAGSLVYDKSTRTDMADKLKSHAEGSNEFNGLALVSLNNKLHEAVENIERSQNAEGTTDSKKVLNSLFRILLEQVPQLAQQPTFVRFANMNASQLRQQCEFVQLLAKLFAAFDPNETGKVSLDLLKSSLNRVCDSATAEKLLMSIAPDSEGNIDYPALLRVIRKSSK